MKNMIMTAALSIAAISGASASFADAHADPLMTICGDFVAMDLLDQEKILSVLVGDIDGAMTDEISIGLVAVECNGNDDKMVAEMLDNDADS